MTEDADGCRTFFEERQHVMLGTCFLYKQQVVYSRYQYPLCLLTVYRFMGVGHRNEMWQVFLFQKATNLLLLAVEWTDGIPGILISHVDC